MAESSPLMKRVIRAMAYGLVVTSWVVTIGTLITWYESGGWACFVEPHLLICVGMLTLMLSNLTKGRDWLCGWESRLFSVTMVAAWIPHIGVFVLLVFLVMANLLLVW